MGIGSVEVARVRLGRRRVRDWVVRRRVDCIMVFGCFSVLICLVKYLMRRCDV